MHRPWAACACCTQSLHSSALPSPPSVYFSSAFEYIPSCRGGGLLRKPVFFATRRGMYVATFYISYLQLKTWSKRIHNRLGCGMYLRVSTAFGVFKRSYHDGSWAFSNLKHFECTSFVITLLYRFKTCKPQTPYKHSFPTPKFYKMAEINFNHLTSRLELNASSVRWVYE